MELRRKLEKIFGNRGWDDDHVFHCISTVCFDLPADCRRHNRSRPACKLVLLAIRGLRPARALGIATRRFDDFISEANISIEPVTEIQARIAREAYRDFGKGSGHPARLNFGDCFSYALAKEFGEVLLFKGSDFSHTDMVTAL